MFGLGLTEIIVIMIVVLIAFGPKHLPTAARSIGRAMAEFRRSVDEVTRELNTPTIERSEPRISAPPAEQKPDAPAGASPEATAEKKDEAKSDSH